MPVREAEGDFDHVMFARLVELRDELSAPPPPPKAAPDLSTKRAKLTKRRERLIDLASDGTIGKEDLRAGLAKVDAERLALDAAEATPPAPSPAKRRAELREVGKLVRAWRRMPARDKRTFVGRVAVSVALSWDRSPVPAWRPAEELDLALAAETLERHLLTPEEERTADESLRKALRIKR